MSGKKKVHLLSEYIIDEKDKKMSSIINTFNKYQKEGEYYQAIFHLENLLLQDGTSQKYNYIFLKYIITNIENLIKDINEKQKEKKKKIKKLGIYIFKENKDLAYLNEVDKYDFYYLRDCFDKYEIALDNQQLKEIYEEKLDYNKKIIMKENNSLKQKYSKFTQKILTKGNFVSPNEIYETINEFNKIIKNKDYKLFYLYKYLDCKIIEKNLIFEYLEKDIFYLNQFYFPKFDGLGIPIGYCDNINIKYRYIFSILKNKIIQNEIDFQKENKAIKFIFQAFKNIFQKIKKNKIDFIKYFSFLFANVIFDVERNIIFTYRFQEIPLYFKNICNQFIDKDEIDKNSLSIFHNDKNNKISFGKNGVTMIQIDDEKIEFNNDEYSINSFLNNFIQDSWIEHISIIKNKSQRFLCKDKIYGQYFEEFINLLRKICTSNVAKIMQSLHEEFKQYKPFYENKDILEDLFKNRLKFYPFECKGLYGITDKYLLEIYLSSIYSLNSSRSFNQFCKKYPQILIIFNMSFNSVIFQNQSLNHYIRAYLFYSYDSSENIRKISINAKKYYCYYPKQKLNEIENIPKYLNKFIVKLKDKELKELKSVSNLDYKKFLEQTIEKEMEIDDNDNENNSDTEMNNNDINNNHNKTDSKEGNNIICNSDDEDEGYYYERQLFTEPNEPKLKEFNFLQALMLLDEDAYNLDPIHFHFCFLKLKNANNYKLIKENFRSHLLKSLLENIDFSKGNENKNMTFITNRNFTGEMIVQFERSVCDVMPSFIRNTDH